MHTFPQIQRAGTARIPNARFVATTRFARPKELSPTPGRDHHCFGNAESYLLIGDGLGRKIITMLGKK